MSEDIIRLLTDKNFAHLATLMKDGSPQVTPTWIDYADGYVLINTAEGRVKHRNVSRDPRVALSITDSNNPYHMVAMRGKVIEQVYEGADEHIDKLAKRYLGLDKYPLRAPNEKRVILKIKPEHIYHQKPPR
ncbi:MAG: PPOX class F420-dependent oxidoreductase [Candidatus Nitrosothermus koennekii]|nr:MAG: PPOX class F420-dependent oxidoreductase [Candidatus Nitrosothermus koennekii]